MIKKQIIRSATSVAANYRASCRARSKKEFVSKLGVVEEEADETAFWLEMLIELNTKKTLDEGLQNAKNEAIEILKIFSASRKTAKLNK